MLVVGRARPRVSYNKTNTPGANTRSQPSSTMQPKQIRQQKGHALIRHAATQEPPDRMPKPNVDAMPAQAFINTERRFVALSSWN